MRRRLLSMAGAVLLCALAAACGGSKAPGVHQAPSGPTQTAAAATTPKPPPALASKPSVSVPKGAAPNHLVVKDLIKGSGSVATAGHTATVNYVGVLYSTGKEFDSSWSHGKPFPFQIGQGSVIKGWDQGVVGMRVGGRRELFIPPSLGYGASGSPPTIPPNSSLVFVVDLLSVS